jgi:hypothetical protein
VKVAGILAGGKKMTMGGTRILFANAEGIHHILQMSVITDFTNWYL